MQRTVQVQPSDKLSQHNYTSLSYLKGQRLYTFMGPSFFSPFPSLTVPSSP